MTIPNATDSCQTFFGEILIAAFLVTGLQSFAQSCSSGDCQAGVISGPYSAPQASENTAPNFPVCTSASCQASAWVNNQIEGIDAQQNFGTPYQFYDNALNLDTNIAVGESTAGENAQVLQWVNFRYLQAFDKVTGQPIFTKSGGTTAMPQNAIALWPAAAQPECQTATGNVQVIYDRIDNRFIISRRTGYMVGGIEHYAICLAVSSRSDLSSPQTVWYAYDFRLDTVLPCVPSSNNCTAGGTYYYFPDWPRIGTWSNGFYLTFDLQDSTEGFSEAGFEACRLDRAGMVLGQAANPMTCYTYLVPAADQPTLIHSLDVADIDSASGPPIGESEYFLGIVNPSNAQQGGNGQTLCTSATTPCTSNQLALFTWGASGLAGPNFIPVNPYTPGCYDTSGRGTETNTVCVQEPSTNPATIGAYGSPSCGDFNTPCVDSLGDRLANRLTYNNFSFSGIDLEFLTASHVVMENTANQSTGIRYYILGVHGGNAFPLINSGGKGPADLADPDYTLFYFMPSAALDQYGNLGMTYTVSGAYCSTCHAQPNPAVYFDVLPLGISNFGQLNPIVAGIGDEENTYHWGQYAATVIDPTDNLTFYGVGEYFNTSQTGTSNCSQPASECYTWQTRIFRAKSAF
jgi:hypothetical protein